MDNPDLYATSYCMQDQFTSRVLTPLWPSLDWDGERGRVLDVGCGAGDVTAQQLLPRLPADVALVAADLSPTMIAKASSRYSGPRLCFCQLDIDTRNLEETSVWKKAPFSKVFSFFCLHWIQDQRNALRNINKLLLPGGEVVLIIPSHSKMFSMYETLAKTRQWAPYMHNVQQYVTPYQHSDDPEDELMSYLQDAGFSVKMCVNHADISYDSSEEQHIIDTITAINPFVGKLPEELRQLFMRDSVSEGYRNGMLSARRTSAGATYSFHHSILVAHAVKARVAD